MENEQNNKSFLDIFGEFAKGIESPELSFDEEGDCELLVGNDLVINIHYDNEIRTVLTYAVVADIDGIPNRNDILVRMLRSNYFWTANKGFTISLDHDSDKVIIMDRQADDYFENADAFATYIGACADVAYEWRRSINEEYLAAMREQDPGIDIMEENNEEENNDDTP